MLITQSQHPYAPDHYFAEIDGRADFNGWPVNNFDAKPASRIIGPVRNAEISNCIFFDLLLH